MEFGGKLGVGGSISLSRDLTRPTEKGFDTLGISIGSGSNFNCGAFFEKNETIIRKRFE